RDEVGVGSFLVVLEAVAAAGRGDPGREIDAQAPAAQVDHVDAVVAQLAVAPVPEPVPVVVQVVGAEGPPRGRALPQLVIQPLRPVGGGAAAGGGAVVEVPRLGQVGPADGALAHLLDGLDHAGPAAALVAHLHLPVVPAGGGHHQLALARVVAAGLLDVDV